MATKELLTPETIIQRNDSKFLASAIGEEIVMMNIDNGDYIGINSVGGDIWNILTEPMSVKDLIGKTMELYEVSAEQGTEEINGFLKRMLDQEMIVIQAA